MEVSREIWEKGEEAAKEVVKVVHPTLDSEEKRRDVIDYIQRLVRNTLGCEVFPYGSVPLKTYLPDGDIDLTALTIPTAINTLPRDILAVLQSEENNRYAEYNVKDTQFIDAEVKLVKCLVENIVIDLSFNQIGGLSTLCFLEQVDRRVGKDHLFKRSIILVKTWCYYESRILGAHHGLISTYAMETLVLYIFNLFHVSLDGPLAVLHKFLDYFSRFDWDNYCISLNGPVRKSCLPDLVVDMSHSAHNDYLLSEEFLRNCIDMFSFPVKAADTKPQVFPPKHLNIVDPLKENNNLGRSVNRGNFYRIRSAFRFGARKLGKILMLPKEQIAAEIRNFFANTFDRHSGKLTLPTYSSLLHEEMIRRNSTSLASENKGGDFELDRYSTEINYMPMVSKMGQSTGAMSTSISLPAGEFYPGTANHFSNSLSQYYRPRPQSSAEIGKFDHWMLSEGQPANTIHEKAVSDSSTGEHRNNHSRPCNGDCYPSDNYDRMSNLGSGVMSPDGSICDDLALDLREKDFVDVAGSPENFNPLSDLSGDYDSNIRSLLYGQCCLGGPMSTSLMLNPPPTFASQFVSKLPWNTAHRSMSMTHGSSSPFIDNRMNLGWAPHPANVPGQLNPGLFIEETQDKARGTGTYLPNGCGCRERPSRGRGRHHGPGNYRQYQRPHSAPILSEKKSSDKGDTHNEQILEVLSPALLNENTGVPQESNTSAFDESEAVLQKLEFGSLGNSDGSGNQASDSSSGAVSIAGEVMSAEPLLGSNHERVGIQSYNLKDEDFPPLTV